MIIEQYTKNHSTAYIAITVNKGCREFLVSIEKPRYSQFTTFPHDQFREALRQFDEYKAELDGKNKYFTKAVLFDILHYLGGQDHLFDEVITHLVMNKDYDPSELEQVDGLTGEDIHNALQYCLDPTHPIPQDEEEEQLCLYH